MTNSELLRRPLSALSSLLKDRSTNLYDWSGILEKYEIAEKLRTLPRTGWVIRMQALGFDQKFIQEHAENVWDHSNDVAGLILRLWRYSSLPETALPIAMSMAKIHDAGEAKKEFGDKTPYDGIAKPDFTIYRRVPAEQHKKKITDERLAVIEVIKPLPIHKQRELLSLWDAFNAQMTPLAQFVRDCDVLSAALKAQEYVKQGIFPSSYLKAFKQQAREDIRNTALQNIVLYGAPLRKP